MQKLIDLKLFQLKESYFSTSHDCLYHSYYDIYIQSKNIQESRISYETTNYVVKQTNFLFIFKLLKI